MKALKQYLNSDLDLSILGLNRGPEEGGYLFYAIVYSYVNVQTREVYDYECRGIRLETAEYGSSQDEIEQFLKDCPEHKMW